MHSPTASELPSTSSHPDPDRAPSGSSPTGWGGALRGLEQPSSTRRRPAITNAGHASASVRRSRYAAIGNALGLAMITGALALATGCGPRTDDRMIKWVTPEEAQKAMHDKTGPLGLGGTPDGVYLDPRSEGKYILGHIPGAINIPFPKIEVMYPMVRDRSVIVVYTTDYADDDFSIAASKRLMELGSKHVLTLRGGMKAWEQSGGEIEK